MRMIFVTGSGTGVGKTYVAAQLLVALAQSGLRVAALKPIATGFDADRPEHSDAAGLLRALGRAATPQSLQAINPWRYDPPISPDIAAERASRPIVLSEVLAFCREPRPADILVIEGIGGVMTPLGVDYTVLDWIEALAAPTLLVTGSYLGTLTHTLTAAGMLEARGIPLFATVVSECLAQPVPLAETVATLERLQTSPVLGWPRDAASVPAATLLDLIREFEL